MKQIFTIGSLIASFSVLNNVDAAMDVTSERVKEIADILEEIDNNMEVEEDDKDLYL